jgi:GT2 family glycosyltransferase
MPEKIGLVTITFNSEKVIEGFLDSVSKQDYKNFVLYIVDNDSKDGTIPAIEKHIGNINHQLIKNASNIGVAAGNNQGIKRAMEDGCDYILLINNDVEFEPALFTKLLDKSKSTGYQIIVPKMMYYNDPEILWFGGGGFNKRMGYMNYHIGQDEKDEGQYPDREITYAPTCCALVSKKVFEKVGLMDEKYFVYFDDTDFMYRVMMDGTYKMLFMKDAIFYHKVGSLTKSRIGTRSKFKFGDFMIRYSTRNKVYYLRKQKSVLAFLNIIYFYGRMNLRFFLSGRYDITFKKWKLIQSSFFEGLAM